MISTHPTGTAMSGNGVQEEIQDCLRTIVVVGLNTGYEAGFAINKTVNDNFEPN